MSNADGTFEDEYNEFDEFDDDDERGLSGFSVLIIGLVMIGAFVSVVWIAYQQGLKRSGLAAVETPYVAADPEPIKIETANSGEPVEDREVYDVFDGENDEPVTVLAEGPEEPVNRESEDPIAAIAANAVETAEDVSDEVGDRIASLAEEDAEQLDLEPVATEPEPQLPPAPVPATEPTTVSVSSSAAISAISGTHLVQVGAFRSDAEAEAQWSRMQSRLGDFVVGKAIDIERADLGDRGIYHRLRIGPFPSADAARTYCAGLKERGQDCLIKGV